jgi:hypothetical protein
MFFRRPTHARACGVHCMLVAALGAMPRGPAAAAAGCPAAAADPAPSCLLATDGLPLTPLRRQW